MDGFRSAVVIVQNLSQNSVKYQNWWVWISCCHCSVSFFTETGQLSLTSAPCSCSVFSRRLRDIQSRESFSTGRMDPDQVVKLFLGRSQRDHAGISLSDLSGIRAKVVEPNYLKQIHFHSHEIVSKHLSIAIRHSPLLVQFTQSLLGCLIRRRLGHLSNKRCFFIKQTTILQ